MMQFIRYVTHRVDNSQLPSVLDAIYGIIAGYGVITVVSQKRLLIVGVASLCLAVVVGLMSVAIAVGAYREVRLQLRMVAEKDAADLRAATDYGQMRTDQLSLARQDAEVPPEAFLFNVKGALAPITRDSLLKTREALIQYIWKGLNPRELTPAKITEGARTRNMARVVPSAAVKTIDVSSSEKLSGFTEFAEHGNSTCLAIWAQGHEGDAGNAPIMEGAALFLKKQWSRGCDVVIVPMPFRAQGNISIDYGTKGRIWVGANHDAMALIESPEFSAFRLFFDPLYATLNWLQDTGHHHSTILMAGVSGGGWMSVVYPALDDRVTVSISVAGSFPMYLRYLPTGYSFRDLGDWENTYAPFYHLTDYFELYLLSALGQGRHQTLVYNAEDPCCYSASRALTFLPDLERKAKELNIDVSSFIDNSQQKHDISEFAISKLLASDWSSAQAGMEVSGH